MTKRDEEFTDDDVAGGEDGEANDSSEGTEARWIHISSAIDFSKECFIPDFLKPASAINLSRLFAARAGITGVHVAPTRFYCGMMVGVASRLVKPSIVTDNFKIIPRENFRGLK